MQVGGLAHLPMSFETLAHLYGLARFPKSMPVEPAVDNLSRSVMLLPCNQASVQQTRNCKTNLREFVRRLAVLWTHTVPQHILSKFEYVTDFHVSTSKLAVGKFCA